LAPLHSPYISVLSYNANASHWRRTLSASRTYTVILEPADEGGYIVHVPALPEIVTEGDTEAEALAMAKDAIQLVVESRHERGEPIPDDIGEPLVHKLTVAVAA
jgi:antitoxin HicB